MASIIFIANTINFELRSLALSNALAQSSLAYPTSTNTITMRTPDPLWFMQLFEYLSFKAENPTLIPHKRDESDLCARRISVWIKEQNALRNYLGNGVILSDEDVALAKKKINVLESLSIFPWTQRKEEKSNSNFEALEKYVKVNGHCRVPQREPGGLGKYVNRLRCDYKKYRAGKDSTLTDEMVEKLESIGFEWSVKKSTEEAWDSKFAMLCGFKEVHGHCNVPRRTDGDESLTALGRWVVEQRQAKKVNALSEERATKLDSIGIKWSLRN